MALRTEAPAEAPALPPRPALAWWLAPAVVVAVCLAGGERLLVRLPSAEPLPVGTTVTVTCREPVLAFPVVDR